MRRPRKPVPPNTVTVRSFVATMTQIRQFMLKLLTAYGRGIHRGDQATTSHDKVFHRQSFDLLGALRDSSITPVEADFRAMAFCFGKRTNFLNKDELPGNCGIERSSGCGGPPAVSYCFFAGAPGSTAVTPSGLMLKAKNINGSAPGFPHWCTRAYGS